MPAHDNVASQLVEVVTQSLIQRLQVERSSGVGGGKGGRGNHAAVTPSAFSNVKWQSWLLAKS